MSDWTKQAEELMETWTKAQQQLWDAWKAVIPKASTAQATPAWGTIVTFWKQAIDQTVRTQDEWATMWADSIRAQASVPKELKDWTDQVVSTMKTWTDSQAQFWEGMLNSLQQPNPKQLLQQMDEGAQVAFQAWQDAIHNAVAAQRELVKYWNSATGDKKD